MKSVIGTHLMKKIGLGLAVSGLQMAKYLSADTATTMNIQPLFAMFLNGCQKYGNINLYLKEEKKQVFLYNICPLLKNCEMKVRLLKIYLWQVHIISFQKMCTREIFFKKITIHYH